MLSFRWNSSIQKSKFVEKMIILALKILECFLSLEKCSLSWKYIYRLVYSLECRCEAELVIGTWKPSVYGVPNPNSEPNPNSLKATFVKYLYFLKLLLFLFLKGSQILVLDYETVLYLNSPLLVEVFSHDDGEVKVFEYRMVTCDERLYQLENSFDSPNFIICLPPTKCCTKDFERLIYH